MRALRAAGHDVTAVSEVALGSSDDIVLGLAVREHRILLTEDKDFGQLVFAAAASASGVILIRYPATTRSLLPRIIVELVETRRDQLMDSFVVVQPSRIRISRGSIDKE